MKRMYYGSAAATSLIDTYTDTSFDVMSFIAENLEDIIQAGHAVSAISDVLFFRFRSTLGQTVFEGLDLNGRSLSVPGDLAQVYVNRVRLVQGSQYLIEAGGARIRLLVPIAEDAEVLISAFAYNEDGTIYFHQLLSNEGLVGLAADMQALLNSTSAEAVAAAASATLAGTRATAAAGSATAAAGSATLAGTHASTAASHAPMASRAAAVAFAVPAPVTALRVAIGNTFLDYVRDASGTALTTAGGVNWSPAEDACALHWFDQATASAGCGARMQAAIDWCVANGRKLRLNRALYILDAPLVVNLPSTPLLNAAGRFRIEGDGSSETVIHFTGSGTAITVNGPTFNTAGALARLTLKGFVLHGLNYTNEGIHIRRVIDWTVDDVKILGFELGHRLTDVVHGRYFGFTAQYNVNGLFASPSAEYFTGTPGSPPNAISFYSCQISHQRGYGAWFNQSCGIQFFGGSFESNGRPGAWAPITESLRWDLRITDGGLNGGEILGCHGTHFESSAGTAYVWLDHGNYHGSYMFSNCGFLRNLEVSPTYGIMADTTGLRQMNISVHGCSFRSAGVYVPSAGAPVMSNRLLLGTIRPQWSLHGNTHPTVVDAPNIGGPIDTPRAQASAWCQFGGATGNLGTNHNVASVVRLGVGSYEITFRGNMEKANFIALVGGSGVTGWGTMSHRNGLSGATIITRDSSGAVADWGEVFVVFYGL